MGRSVMKTRGARARGALAAGLGSALVLAAALKGAASLGDARAPVAPAACAGPTACAELSPAALRGRRIFHHGALASGEPVEGRLGEGGAALRGKAAACAGCHGRSGDGTAEGGVAAPPLTPEQLFSADRPDGPYTAETLAAAVREGRTPSARELHLVMPRYRLDGAHLADLVAYLRCVGRDADPGVSPEALRLGAALPLTGRFAAAGAAARDVLAASFAEVNAQGGVFRRRLELVVADSGESLDGARATSRLLDQRVFALVATVWSGDGDGGGDAPARLAADEVPLVGPLGSGPPAADPGDGVVFHLQPGLDTLARVAVAHLAGAPAPAGAEALLVIHPANPRGDGFLRGARAEAQRRGLPAPVSLPFEPGRFDAAAASAAAARLRPRAVLLAGEGDELSRWLAAPRPSAGTRGPGPAVYAPASLMPQDPGALRRAGAARLLLLHPGPFDEAERLSLLSLSSFLERHRIPSRHTAFQASAYAAASVLVEALKRAGAHLTRPGLVAALEGLRAFDPGPGPAITFGRNRRVGAYGAGLSRVEPSSANVAHVAPVSAWVEVVP
ncbi:ABC transporter substrate-binding protein [Sorangium sp. So ce429]